MHEVWKDMNIRQMTWSPLRCSKCDGSLVVGDVVTVGPAGNCHIDCSQQGFKVRLTAFQRKPMWCESCGVTITSDDPVCITVSSQYCEACASKLPTTVPHLCIPPGMCAHDQDLPCQ